MWFYQYSYYTRRHYMLATDFKCLQTWNSARGRCTAKWADIRHLDLSFPSNNFSCQLFLNILHFTVDFKGNVRMCSRTNKQNSGYNFYNSPSSQCNWVPPRDTKMNIIIIKRDISRSLPQTDFYVQQNYYYWKVKYPENLATCVIVDC